LAAAAAAVTGDNDILRTAEEMVRQWNCWRENTWALTATTMVIIVVHVSYNFILLAIISLTHLFTSSDKLTTDFELQQYHYTTERFSALITT